VVVLEKVCSVKCACCGGKNVVVFRLEHRFDSSFVCGCGVVNFVYCYDVKQSVMGVVVGVFKIWCISDGGYEWKIVMQLPTVNVVEVKRSG
jgi:hypothetical protein